MVNVVKVRVPAAFLDVEDIDAKHMGIIAQREEEAAEGITEKRRQKQLRQSDANEFAAVQAEMKDKAQREAHRPALIRPPKTEKRALPSFVKFPADKRRREGDTDADAAVGDKATVHQAAAAAPAAPKADAVEPLATPSPAAGGLGLGLGGYDSDDDSSAAEDPPAPPAPAGESVLDKAIRDFASSAAQGESVLAEAMRGSGSAAQSFSNG